MRRSLLAAAFGSAAVGIAVGQPVPALTVAGDAVVVRMSARGVQVYDCRAVAGGSPAWAFQEPRADLFIDDQRVGRHFAGPSWEHLDGSRIVGRVAATVPAPAAGAIPWLRLDVASRAGGGILSTVTAVQRINTVGGVLAGACADVGSRSEVPYSADYIMLRNGG